jgi:tRNA U54 and U55 pseudouridine synthase Pus10
MILVVRKSNPEVTISITKVRITNFLQERNFFIHAEYICTVRNRTQVLKLKTKPRGL